ncbi:MAG: carbohydrate kinase [Ancalomicrobiaceae bacterium]|nr:carbohydrate kinase [Ancalomicrobiaceae bacterium]
MILSTGEALFDMIQKPGERLIEPVIGGSTLNVALGLARLGRKTGYLTKLSTDFFGQQIADFFAHEGISTDYVVRAAGKQTTLAFAFLQPGGHADYSFYSSGAADRSMVAADLPKRLPDDVKAVHFGSTLLALEPAATTFTDYMLALAPERFFSFDPNVRASLITDRPLWSKRCDELIRAADFVKASVEDVAFINGGPADAAETAKAWSLAGPKVAVVTDGGKGATVAVGGEAVFVPAYHVEVIDTVGAGDTFQAAYLARLDELNRLDKRAIRGIELAEAVEVARFAVGAAAITCTRRGADLPSRGEVDAFLKAKVS